MAGLRHGHMPSWRPRGVAALTRIGTDWRECAANSGAGWSNLRDPRPLTDDERAKYGIPSGATSPTRSRSRTSWSGGPLRRSGTSWAYAPWSEVEAIRSRITRTMPAPPSRGIAALRERASDASKKPTCPPCPVCGDRTNHAHRPLSPRKSPLRDADNPRRRRDLARRTTTTAGMDPERPNRPSRTYPARSGRSTPMRVLEVLLADRVACAGRGPSDARPVIRREGIPGAQGSKRHVGRGIMRESSKKVAPWRSDVRDAALAAMGDDWRPLTGPVAVDVTFHFPRPPNRTTAPIGRSAGRSSRAPNRPPGGVRRDIDKLVRLLASTRSSAPACGAKRRLARRGPWDRPQTVGRSPGDLTIRDASRAPDDGSALDGGWDK